MWRRVDYPQQPIVDAPGRQCAAYELINTKAAATRAMGSPGRSQGTARAAVQLYRAVSPDFGCTQTPRSFSHRCRGRAVQREGPRSWNSRLTWLLGCRSPGVDQGRFKGLSLSASVRRRDGARGNIFKNSKVNMPTWLEHPQVFCSSSLLLHELSVQL